MVIKFLDELISVTGHPMSLGYSARMVREKRVPEGADPRKLTNVSLIYHTINGIAEIIRGRQLPEAKFIIDHLYNGQAHCMATIRKKKSEIIRAMIFIPSHLSGFDMRGCIVEEMTQILGLPNDSNKITQSIFKDRGRYTELTQILGLTNDDDRVKQSIFVDTNRYDQLDKGLTPQDRLMLRLLYNPRMKPGTPRGQALKLATEILTKLRPGGAIR